MTNIFEIKKEYIDLMNEVINNEGEFTPELLEKLEINEKDLKDKAINYAYVIKNIEYENEIIDIENNRLKELKARNNIKITNLKKTVKKSMEIYNIDKIDSPILKLSLRKSESVNITDESKIPHNLIKTTISTLPDKNAIKAALKSGSTINGAEIVTNINLQIK
tara:strand:+ start:10018 stop:10509 length:492 start_codon:yes stop_codon:yes gene_type:complete